MKWMELLRGEVDRQSIGKVAAALDLSRSTISLVLSGKYMASTKNIKRKVLSLYGKASCPFLGRVVSGPECRSFRERAVPMNHHQELEHWQACQSCDTPILPDDSVPERE